MENGFDKDLEDFLSKPVLTSNIGQLQDNSQPTNGTNAPERRQETTVYNNNNNYRGSNVRGTYHNRSYGNVSHDGQWRTLRYQQDCLKQAESVFLQTKSEWEAKATVFQQNFKNQREDLKLKATSLELVESSLKEEQKKNEEKFATLIRAERTGRVATLCSLFESNSGKRLPFTGPKRQRLVESIEKAMPILDNDNCMTLKAMERQAVPEWMQNEILDNELLFQLTPGVFLVLDSLAEYRKKFRLVTFD